MIRAAGPDDAAAIAALEGDWSTAAAAETLATPACVGWVHAGPDGVDGHIVCLVVADTAEIVRIAVRPAARRGGIGRALLRHAQADWVARGVVEAFLEVRRDNAAASGLYAACGWREVAVRRRYYADGTDARVMQWTDGS